MSDAPVTEEARTARTRELNDAARRLLPASHPREGFARVHLSRGVGALPPPEVVEVLREVRDYQNFTQGNDPYREHDFGVLAHVRGHWTQEPQPRPAPGERGPAKIFFKVDYYAAARPGVPPFTHGSEAPWDADATDRVLTIYLAEEH